jgi:MobA/MobL family
MAIYHASTSAVSRGSGHSTTAKSAYISCDKITDEITGEIHNYENKKGLEHSDIVLPDGIDKKISASELWNKAELAEGRKDSRVGREWVVGLPHELNKEQRINLSQAISQELANRYQVGTQYAIHEPSKKGDQRNYHVHILTTTRKLDQALNLTEKSDIERDRKQCTQMGIANSKEQIIQCREMIANQINQALERACVNEKVTEKSFKDLGIDKVPTKHIGKEATHLERKGQSTEIGDYNRQVHQYNQLKISLDKMNKELYHENQQESSRPSVNDLVRQYFSEKDQVQVKQESLEYQKKKQDLLLQSILAKHKSVDKIVEQYKQSEQQKKAQQQKEREKTFVQEISRSKSRGFER